MAKKKESKPAPVTTPAEPRAPYVRKPDPEGALQESMLAGLMFPHAHYGVDVGWSFLEGHLANEFELGFDPDPDYQREHKWTDAQRAAYIEHVILGGEVGKTILVGHTGEAHRYRKRPDDSIYLPDYSLIDGKQRLETIRRFMRGELRVFQGIGGKAEGYTWQECGRTITHRINASIRWQLVVVPTRAELMKLYLKFNFGGVAHTSEEREKVVALIALEEQKGEAGHG